MGENGIPPRQIIDINVDNLTGSGHAGHEVASNIGSTIDGIDDNLNLAVVVDIRCVAEIVGIGREDGGLPSRPDVVQGRRRDGLPILDEDGCIGRHMHC